MELVCGTCEAPSAEIFKETSREFRFEEDLSFRDYLLSKYGFSF